MCEEAQLYSYQTAARGWSLHFFFFPRYIICGKGKQDLWALNTGRDAPAAFTMMMGFGRKGERGCFALSMNYV